MIFKQKNFIKSSHFPSNSRFFCTKVKKEKPIGPQGGKTKDDPSIFTGTSRLWSMRPNMMAPIVTNKIKKQNNCKD
jgi:hypothetical protein